MIQEVIFTCLVAVSFANPVSDVAQRDINTHIVGGIDADIRDFPYQLSLQYLNSHICGASIISEKWTLSAAHCVQSVLNLYSVRAGSSLRERGGIVHPVSKIVKHRRYNGDRMDYDFALLRVATAFVFGVGVAPIALPQLGQETSAGSDSIVTGWGLLTVGGRPSSKLQKATIPVTSLKSCADAYPAAITVRMICAGKTEGGVDSCQGDSGGPMVVNNELIGVVSWGDECAMPGKPGVYAKVSSVRDWIDATAAATPSRPFNLITTLCLAVVVLMMSYS